MEYLRFASQQLMCDSLELLIYQSRFIKCFAMLVLFFTSAPDFFIFAVKLICAVCVTSVNASVCI